MFSPSTTAPVAQLQWIHVRVPFFLSAIIFLLSEGCTFDTDEGVLLEYARGIGIIPIMRLHQVKLYDQLVNLSHISIISSPRDNFSSNLLFR